MSQELPRNKASGAETGLTTPPKHESKKNEKMERFVG